MIAKTEPFRVVIAGGGIAGLTLANALQHAEIDYVLLERRSTINPQTGASLGLLASGGRIMDQLNVHGALEDEMEPLTFSRDRWSDGTPLTPKMDMPVQMQQRTGYPITFMDRKRVLGTFYEKIWDKNKVLTNKSISKVEHGEEGVTVYCEDGTSYHGDVLAGCDGVNSKVRSEMWRIADEEKPGAIPQTDKEAVFAEFRCLFGICSKVEGTELGGVEVSYYKDHCCLVVVGKDYRTYFFLTQRYPKRYQYGEIPKIYSQEDMDSFAEANLDRKIHENLTFREFWERREVAALAPVEEAEFKIWSWGRIVCVGDSIHKMAPQAAQGANSAVESAAALANQLYRMKQQAKGDRPTFSMIRKGLEAYQKKRTARIGTIMEASNELPRLQALTSWSRYIQARYVLPFLGDFLTDILCEACIGAEMIEYLPPPPRSLTGSMPFNPAQGTGNTESRLLRACVALPLLGFAALAMRAMDVTAYAPQLLEISKRERFEANGISVPMLSRLYRVNPLDQLMSFLAAYFAHMTMGSDPITYWQTLTFIADFAGMYAVLLVESSRRVNNFTFMQWPTIFGIIAQLRGAGTIIPVYFFLSYTFTPIEKFAAADQRLTNLAYSGGVLPAVIIGYLIPHFLSYLHPLLEARNFWTWIWQPFPIWTAILLRLLKASGVTPDTIVHDRCFATQRDRNTLRLTGGFFAILSAVTYIYTLFSSSISPRNLFVPSQIDPTADLAGSIRSALQLDQICSYGAGLLWIAFLFDDMKRAGMVDWSWASMLAAASLIGTVFGPGTLFMVAWMVREEILATRRHKAALTPETAARWKSTSV